MTHLTPNDLRRISRALEAMIPDDVTRDIDGVKETVRALPAGKGWGVAMVVQYRRECGGMAWSQNFESLEEMRRYI